MVVNKNYSKGTHKKGYKKLLVTIGLIVLLDVIVVSAYIMLNKTSVNEKPTSMETYLKEKYNKEFIVENVRVEGEGFGVEGDLTGDAKSIDSEPLEFSVWEDPPGRYHDTYLDIFWSKQEKTDLDEYIKKLQIRPVRQGIDIHAYPFTNTLTGIPALKDMLKENSKKIIYGVVVVFEGDGVTDQDMRNLRSLINYAKSNNAANNAVRYVINSKERDSRYFCQYYGGDANGPREDLAEEKYIASCFKYSTGRE